LRVGAAADRRKHMREVMDRAIVPSEPPTPWTVQDGGMDEFERVWRRIVASAGRECRTKFGFSFHYRVDGLWVITDRMVHRIPKSDFAAAWTLMRLRGPGYFNDGATAPSYVHAILTDPHIVVATR
jgi:hypothetical protein